MKNKLFVGIVFIIIISVFGIKYAEEKTLVESYIKENISSLSPEKEVLGGKFYVTSISFRSFNGGEVRYEDGHIALTADFSYFLDKSGKVHITSFKILKEK